MKSSRCSIARGRPGVAAAATGRLKPRVAGQSVWPSPVYRVGTGRPAAGQPAPGARHLAGTGAAGACGSDQSSCSNTACRPLSCCCASASSASTCSCSPLPTNRTFLSRHTPRRGWGASILPRPMHCQAWMPSLRGLLPVHATHRNDMPRHRVLHSNQCHVVLRQNDHELHQVLWQCVTPQAPRTHAKMLLMKTASWGRVRGAGR